MVKVVDQDIPAGMIDEYGHSLQPATLWKTGTGIYVVNKRKPFRIPHMQNQPYGTPSPDQLKVRAAFSKCVDCFNKSPWSGGAEPPALGHRSREWWYNASLGSGLWYYDYFIQQSWQTFFDGNTPDWCKEGKKIYIPANSNEGVKTYHSGAEKTYCLQIFSEPNMDSEKYFPDHCWLTWPMPWQDTYYWYGGAVALFINKEPHWAGGTGGGMTDNQDYNFPACKGTTGSEFEGKKEAADCARGAKHEFTLNDGEYFILMCRDTKAWYGDNTGGVTFKLF